MKVGSYCPKEPELKLLIKCLPNTSRVMLLNSKVGYHKKAHFTENGAAEVVSAFDNLTEIAICIAFIMQSTSESHKLLSLQSPSTGLIFGTWK